MSDIARKESIGAISKMDSFGKANSKEEEEKNNTKRGKKNLEMLSWHISGNIITSWSGTTSNHWVEFLNTTVSKRY